VSILLLHYLCLMYLHVMVGGECTVNVVFLSDVCFGSALGVL